ncbi:hypothetical protein PUNSTDRAFT_123209 [Punctularia strigosozonata HHB-11173 SS5]|uniref:Uncharacterized protein n=1 Tax=Punctularia strigosozonata (strain HHB-11173) TaxID=741275 RepID=R7RZS5_PUNST|nr:uncharacterized protein PUNSTDRAFT_123209 [Punctularia strigosozonata HHB-11173 SS5]EIN03615.1 hypothetical protein PUNSTDRAFT_123209 [Punctularia strigosozonata HHB-11173 SS5]
MDGQGQGATAQVRSRVSSLLSAMVAGRAWLALHACATLYSPTSHKSAYAKATPLVNSSTPSRSVGSVNSLNALAAHIPTVGHLRSPREIVYSSGLATRRPRMAGAA